MKKSNTQIIRSSKLSIVFSNSNKKIQVENLIDEYHKIVSKFVHIIWNEDHIKPLLSKEYTTQIQTWLSARMVQCAGKQASGIVRGTKKKQEKRLWKINDFKAKGMFKKARQLQAIYDQVNISKPNLNTIECELDERFVKQDFNNDTSFDGWITLSSIGNKMKLILPVKKTKHFNKMNDIGKRLKGIRLSRNMITFNFELTKVPLKSDGKILGIDIGKIDTITCSNGFQSQKDIHGHNLDSIINDMSRKRKGSKAFLRKQQHRQNYINWSINTLNLSEYKQINIEKIKHLRRGKRSSRKLSLWTYTEIFDKLKDKSLELGVQVKEINPTYTSQRCSHCGFVRKANRKGKLFKCTSCGFTQDADLNASINLAFDLPAISKEVRLKNLNRKGFYWNSDCQQSIVADAEKTHFSKLI